MSDDLIKGIFGDPDRSIEEIFQTQRAWKLRLDLIWVRKVPFEHGFELVATPTPVTEDAVCYVNWKLVAAHKDPTVKFDEEPQAVRETSEKIDTGAQDKRGDLA